MKILYGKTKITCTKNKGQEKEYASYTGRAEPKQVLLRTIN
jgi:hypothetical protein